MMEPQCAPLAIGIDLGTTNSLISVWQDGQAVLIPNALNEFLTPSVVSIDEDGSILVGRAALSRLTTHPERSASVFKRYMGSKKPFKLAQQHFGAPELSALVLKSLKADAETYLGQPVSDVVISVPAYFSDEQRKQTRFAAELAGLNAVRLINEPTAASMAYGLHTQNHGRTLVFDLGGGTFDITILEYALPLIEVQGSAGDNYLGGEDFTQALMNAALKEWRLSTESIPATDLSRLYHNAEQLKYQFNGQTARYELSWHWQDNHWCMALDELRIENIWLPLINRLRAPIEQALHDARLQPQQLDHLVLVGGASRMNIIQKLVVRLFGKLPHQHLDPSTIVALGAAAQAACRLRNEDIEEVILTDVCPYTLGIATAEEKRSGIFSPILERNTVVPTSRVETYSTRYPNQKAISIAIYQGESPHVDNNIFIDEFDVPVQPNGRLQSLDVRFSYDINGLLEVDVNIPDSGGTFSKVIDHSPTGLTEQQRRESHQRLSCLKIHPRDSLRNRALLARIDKAWAQTLGDQRRQIGSWLREFETVLAGQDADIIAPIRQRLEHFLDDMQL
ncbi:molecular chaperone HscC [Yersinia nurmii]|uniref:Molecular chaperone DnaK n=1 Tax=Yersinia nurmii TaxID=685706 RepID=A0AAW7K0R9_9GAMM|nr:molecular chaperone HscC [Yersinia nurmii]MDN0088708.1 molecular chaperone HscC [Yersinia nurmii]CNE94620.1 molecular chaperone DnaK [Yersinia nurmii]